ncbi:MAG TPA: protein kinase [Planctomycetota bacterium]|nr:protein kinase [Planctomycetota bacterium]
MARLVWKQRGGEERTFDFGDGAVLGRDGRLDFVLDRKSVSRRHARIERRDLEFYITDLGSTNGTLVNGTPVHAVTRVAPGDLIQLGEETLELVSESAPVSQAPTRAMTGHLTRSSSVTAPLDVAALAARGHGLGEGSAEGKDALPRREGKFYLLRRLGLGGMGTVYHAIDLDSNREIAVKFIRSSLGRNEAFLDFFHNREAVLAREIEHPNVIRVYEHGIDAEQHFISMEYVRGRNLYHVMKERRLDSVEVLETVRQVACGLVAAHRQGVVHSDIKPANILLLEEEGEGAADLDGPSPAGGARDGAPDSILEFEAEPTLVGAPSGGRSRYEPGLLEEIRRRVGEPPLDVVVDPPYFLRQSETTFLGHYFERLLEGRGHFVLVEGEAGTGKNRLLSEFLKERKTVVDALHGPRGENRVQFHEFDVSRIEGIPLFYEALHGLRPGATSSLRQTAEDAARNIAEDPAPKIIRLLHLGSAIPVACDLVFTLGQLLSKKRILLLATLSPGEIRANGSLKPLLEQLSPYTKELYLRPLTEYQIQRYLQQIFRDAMTGLSLAGDVYRLSGGNFARMLEILRGFFERGILSMDQPSGRLRYRPRAQEFELEEGKNFYEKYRLHGKVEQRILEQAAFIGSRFLFDTLLKLHDINETSLFFILRTLLTEGFLFEDGRTWYRFTNVAFQRYLAERMPAEERPHLHRRISRLLQMVPVAESPELLQLRARHFAGCHEYAKAVQCLLEGMHMARCEYRVDLSREMVQEVLRIYRLLARREATRREVTGILREWFRKDGNWYEILGEIGSDAPVARIKVADFGISFRLVDEERGYQLEKRPVLGTPRYMAPERGKGEYGGFKSDIFSLGIITYEMAVGEPPFLNLKGSEAIQANRERRIELPVDESKRFPPGMDALLAGMLEKEPLRRWDAERVVREVVKLQFDARSLHR